MVKILIHSLHQTQTNFQKANKALVQIFLEYLNYANVFVTTLAIELAKRNGINDYIIKLIKSKQLFYRLIYSLGLVKLEILKTYIKTYFKIAFI